MTMTERNVWGEAVPQLSELQAIDLIEAGHSVYSRERRTSRDYPIGGTVWRIEPYMDGETGEARRRFHVIRGDDGRLVFDTVDSSEVDTDALQRPNIAVVRDTVRITLARELMRRASGPWLREDFRIVEAQYELARVLTPNG